MRLLGWVPLVVDRGMVNGCKGRAVRCHKTEGNSSSIDGSLHRFCVNATISHTIMSMTFPARAAALVLLAAGTVTAFAGGAAAQTSAYWKPVQDALGQKGTVNPDGVLKFSFPRTDLTVVVDGVTLKPALALGSWMAFKRGLGDAVMMMGDLVLLEDEVAPVMVSLQENGVEQTALHNHVLNESPRVMYMHIKAIGNPSRIAKAIRMALEASATPLGPPVKTAATTAAAMIAAPNDLDTAAIARIIGVRGRTNGGVYQVSIPRREKILEDKKEIPSSMGLATAINFQPTGAGKAAVTGDFVLIAREVNQVIWALSENGIAVTAIHSHMLVEQPRLFFMHFWAIDDADKLARGLRAALDRTRRRR
jgi:hypothetical protein